MEHAQTPPWERADLSPQECAIKTIEYHRSQGRDDPEFLGGEVIRVLSEQLARAYAAGCRRQLERAEGDIESLLRRPRELEEDCRTIEETLDELRAHVLGLFGRYGLEIPESFLRTWPTIVFFDWHEELRSGRFPEIWKEWEFREPKEKEREKVLSNFGLACDYAKWTLVRAVEIKRSLDVTWQLWTGPLGYGELVNALSGTLELLARIRPEHVIAGIKTHQGGQLGAAYGKLGGRPPEAVKAAIIKRLQDLVDDGREAKELFWDFDGEAVLVNGERCSVWSNHDSEQLFVECTHGDEPVSLVTFLGYVTTARKLNKRSR